MAANKKPRKAYRPRRICADTMGLVTGAVAKPSQADREHLLGMVRAPVKALREGVATELEWAIIAGAVALAKAIESMRIVRGLVEHLASAEAALHGIYTRAMATGEWEPTALYYQELDAVQTFVELYTFQINQLSRDEISKAARLATNQVNKIGHAATVARTADQLNLLGATA